MLLLSERVYAYRHLHMDPEHHAPPPYSPGHQRILKEKWDRQELILDLKIDIRTAKVIRFRLFLVEHPAETVKLSIATNGTSRKCKTTSISQILGCEKPKMGVRMPEMPKWGSPPSALGQNGKSGVAQPLKLHRSFRSAPGQNVGTPISALRAGF